MSKNKPIARIDDEKIEFIAFDLCPTLIKKGNFRGWVESRAVDTHRTNSRLLKRIQRLSGENDYNVVMKYNAATITDNFWVKEEGSELTFDEVMFKNNRFDNVALNGDINGFSIKPERTPELTNTGSYEKCWRRENGYWWMYKRQSMEESYSEIMTEKVGVYLGFDMAHYERAECGVKTRDFTDNARFNFESAFESVGDNDDYAYNYEFMKEYHLEKDYLKMIYLDSICMSVDRHTRNFGFLKDSDNGKFIKLAPNYDNNISLISRGDVSLKAGENFADFFIEFINNNRLNDTFRDLKIHMFDKDELIKLSVDTGYEVNHEKIAEFIIHMQEYINKSIKK